MEPSKEAISVRIARLHNIFLGQASNNSSQNNNFSREGLLDALIVLYNECNNDTLRKDQNIGLFVDKFRGTVLELRSLRVNVNDFERLSLIGRGHFGEVQVVRERCTGDVYAMKTIKKVDSLSQQAAAFYEEERDIMARVDSPWLTSLQYAFQDSAHLYLVMEYLPGGDMSTLLDRHEGRLSEPSARFYLAELTLAVRSLHSAGYVHRDLKPANILLDRCGHVKLADFGSAARLTAAGSVVSRMPVGTPEYIAPEVLRAMEGAEGGKKGGMYGVECDYWSLGVVAYEMVLGHTPFSGAHLAATYASIMNHKTSPLRFAADSRASQPFQQLVAGLLDDASVRLGYEQLVKHSFFREVDWHNIRNTAPPLVPMVKSEDDASNFEPLERRANVPSMADYKTRRQFSGRDLPFVGFTFTRQQEGAAGAAVQTDNRVVGLEQALADRKKEVDELNGKLFRAENGSGDSSKDVAGLRALLAESTAQCLRLEAEYQRSQKDNAALRRTLLVGKEEQQVMETKALAMIRDTKAKIERRYKAEICQLQADVEECKREAEESKAANLLLTAQMQSQADELFGVKNEAGKLQGLVISHNDKMNKVRHLSRQSVTGAEALTEQLAQSHRQQVRQLQASVEKERDLRGEAEERWEAEREITTQLNRRCLDLENRHTALAAQHAGCEAARTQLAQLVAARDGQEAQNGAMVAQLEQKLRRERADHCEVKSRLATIEEELSASVASLEQHESTLAARDVERDEQLAAVTEQLKRVTEEKCKLQASLQGARQSEAEVSFKVLSLESLLEQFQTGLSRLEEENRKLRDHSAPARSSPEEGSDVQRQVLEGQVERLEGQLEKLRETAVLERRERGECEAKMRKLEKELSDAKIDLRIARRETRAAEDQVKVAAEDKQRLAAKVEAERALQQAQGDSLNARIADLDTRVADLGAKLAAKDQEVSRLTQLLDAGQVKLADKQRELETAVAAAAPLQDQLAGAAAGTAAAEGRAAELAREAARLKRLCVEAAEREKAEAATAKEREINFNNMQANVTLLKESCTMLDEQLEDYEKLTSTLEAKERSLGQDKLALTAQLEAAGRDLQTARKATNEERSLRLRSDIKVKEVEAELAAKVEDISLLEVQVREYRSMAEHLMQQVEQLEDNCATEETQARNTQRRAEALQCESNAIKEELTRLLTQLHSLKESNHQLSRQLDGCTGERDDVRSQLADARNALEEMQAFHKHREFKTNATLEQQAKLIEFLQRKVEEAGRKKKTLTEKLFGTHQKENILPPGTGFKELENMLFQERSKSQALTDQLMRAQAGLVAQRNDHVIDVVNMRATAAAPVTPATKLAMCKLAQSNPTTATRFQRTQSQQRMHHNIPHRFELKLCMRATKCTACLDSIHFGRNSATCRECGASAHPKCSLVLPATCGLPLDFARHYSRALKDADGDDQSEAGSEAPVRMQGYVKLPQRGNSCWERKYLVLEGSVLSTYEHEPTQGMVAVDTLQLCPTDGATSIVSGVAVSDVPNTAQSDLPYILKVVITPLTTCWVGSSMLIMTLSFADKQAWASALEAVVQHAQSLPPLAAPPKHQGTTVLTMEKSSALDINCVLQPTPALLLMGATEGLYSLRLNQPDAAPVRVGGVREVHQVALVPALGLALMIAGESRTLSQCNLRELMVSAEAAECAQLPVAIKPVLVPTGNADTCCHLFAVATTDEGGPHERTVLCAATADKLILLTWSINAAAFNVVKVLDTSEPCSCIHFAPHSVLVGCNKFFEIDLGNFSAEEFLDVCDRSLCATAQQLNSFPVAILDVSASRADVEYLLCFNEFGVFVDKWGQRTRGDEVKWSHMPFAFAYRKPYLFILHFTSVEVMRLSPDSFTRDADDSTAPVRLPPQSFVELATPRLLGAAPQADAVYMSHAAGGGTAVVVLEGRLACRADAGGSLSSLETVRDNTDTVDLNGCSASEFSFTSSLVQSLDGSTEDSSPPDYRGRHVHFDTHTLHTEL